MIDSILSHSISFYSCAWIKNLDSNELKWIKNFQYILIHFRLLRTLHDMHDISALSDLK